MPRMDVAVVLALSSALCAAISDVMQQRVTHQIADTSMSHLLLFRQLSSNIQWRWGAVVLVASIGLEAAALSQGSVLLVQALLMLSLLFALPISAILTHRTVTAFGWVWAVLLTAAVIVIVTVGNPQAGLSRGSLGTWAVVAAVLAPLLVGCVVTARISGGVLAAVLFALVSGSLWALFAVLTKGVVSRFGDGIWAVMRTPEAFAWVAVAVGALAWEQSAFQAGDLTASMPTMEVSKPLVATALGVFVLGETLNTSHTGVIVLAVATIVMTAATAALARSGAVARYATPHHGIAVGFHA